MEMEPLIVRAARNEVVERPPVWMMRQAGRYMAEYQKLKNTHGFLKLCQTPELATQVTLQPVEKLGVDAAILFSDIMVVPQAMGLKLDFSPGPKISPPIRTQHDIEALKFPDVKKSLAFVFEILRMVKNELPKYNTEHERKGIIGFAGAPWTLACYMIDQGPHKHFQGTQIFAQQNRAAMHTLLSKLTEVVVEYLEAQFESGAQLVQVFDTWGGNLGAADFREFSLPYIQKIMERINKSGCLTILYVGNSGHLLGTMKQSGAKCISVDWRTSLSEAHDRLGEDIVIQGNFDPTHLLTTEEAVRQEARGMVSSWPSHAGYIANLGHGVLPTTPEKNAAAFVRAVQEGW